ncbi:cellulase-domain-containing protein [Hortaea werneckii]|nr:cellulase-domain-containing protein [Hortaea werneckii]
MGLRSVLVATLAAQASAVWLAGVNIAGCDIGMDTSGNYQPEDAFNGQYGCPTNVGPLQMQHFATKDNFNVFRIPVSWQSLVNNDLVTNKLDSSFMAKYDGLIQSCLNTGAYCIIDIHNYARWWGQIVDQGGPQGSKLAETWAQLAAKYKGRDHVIFGIMNEPHDLDNAIWASTLQKAVYAIRDAGATSQMIFLSATNYANAISFPNDAQPLLGIQNRDGTTTNLIFELHQYFDSQGGKNTYCNDPLASKFQDVADYLRSVGRQAFIGEMGSGNGQDCVDIVCPVLDVLNQNGDVFLGWTSWAAGNWWPSYELSEVPNGGDDVGIVAKCFAPKFAASK